MSPNELAQPAEGGAYVIDPATGARKRVEPATLATDHPDHPANEPKDSDVTAESKE